MKYKTPAILFCLALGLLLGCNETIPTTDAGEHYSYDFHDYFSFDITTDTLHVTITQPASAIDTPVTFQPDIAIENDSYLSNQIALSLTVRTNNGPRHPTQVRAFGGSGDSLTVWYAGHPKPDTSYARSKASGSIPAIKSSPITTKYTLKK